MNALCKLCKTNLIATDEAQLSVQMLAHVLQKHHSHPRYEKILRMLVDCMEFDFEVSFDKKEALNE